MLCLFKKKNWKCSDFGKLTHFLMFGYDPKNEPNIYISNGLGRTKNYG